MSERMSGDEVAFRLELTADEMRITRAALRSFLNDFGHDEHDVQNVVRGVLAKLPAPGPGPETAPVATATS